MDYGVITKIRKEMMQYSKRITTIIGLEKRLRKSLILGKR